MVEQKMAYVSRVARYILVLLYLQMLGSNITTTGKCIFNGSQYNNQSVWKTDPCHVCRCEDPVTLCDVISCTHPKCNYSHGERLELIPGHCCPVCSPGKRLCDFQGRSVAHLTEWTSASCSTCQCDDGRVQCVNLTCPKTPCPPGQVSQLLPGQCCSKCIPAGKSCVDYLGQGRLDGSEWSPLPCVQCVCRNGHTKCMTRECPQEKCAKGLKLIIAKNECCPSCIGKACSNDDHIYQDGTTWQKDPCTFCTCRDGTISCKSKECDSSTSCSKRQTLIRRKEHCCSQCMRKDKVCQSPDLTVHYHGDLWQQEPCQYCACRNSKITCRMVRCRTLVCRQGEERKRQDGKCCDECVISKTCQYQGKTYQNNQRWDPDSCSACQCLDGKVKCYRQTCPACPPGSISVSVAGGSEQCCGLCQPEHCADECASCSASNPHHCTMCKEGNKFVQDGRCVDQCSDGFYLDMDKSCKACHHSCSTCFHKSSHHCLSCGPASLLRDGQCVLNCGPGYFSENKLCVACHPSCFMCSGPHSDQCKGCANSGQVLMGGYCVNQCDSSFYQKGQECIECPETCQTCLSDAPTCASCINGYFLQYGECLPICDSGFYADSDSVCHECHPSCKECRGPTEENCISCFVGVASLSGTCEKSDQCWNGQYLSNNGFCVDCSDDCEICHPGKIRIGSICSMCMNSNQVSFEGRCAESCPLGTYLRDKICHSCEAKCSHCEGPSRCNKCFPPFILSNGHCVRECESRHYPDLPTACQSCAPNCLQCIDQDFCIACDLAFLLENGKCVENCSPGFIPRNDVFMCEENLVAPVLEVLKPLTVVQGHMVDVNEETLFLTDQDTSDNHLNILVERMPKFGKLIKMDMNGNTVLGNGKFFSLKDLNDDKIQFLQDSGNAKEDELVVRAFDGGLYGEQKKIEILIDIKDKLQLLTNKPLVAKRGRNTPLTTTTVNVRPPKFSSASEITFTVLNGPLHGTFRSKKFGHISVRNFTLVDLQQGDIVYSDADNNSEAQDIARMKVEDASQQLQFILSVTILSQMDFQPVMVANSGGSVMKEGMLEITKAMLEAKVQDIENVEMPYAVYILTPIEDNPKYGELMMIVPIPQEGLGQGWTDIGSGMMGAKVFRFTQSDIDEGRIFYIHTGLSIGPESFSFEVADTADPPNILKDQLFELQILSDETASFASPTLAPGVRLSITVFENQIIPLTNTHIAFEDASAGPQDIIYQITTLLGEGEGTVEHIDFPYTPILRFTQEDINGNKIIYRPPDEDIGMSEIQVSFFFIVSVNGKRDKPKEHEYVIRIIPVDNNPPRFINVNPEFTIAEGGIFPITSDTLRVVDVDTPLTNLEITLAKAPSMGLIEKKEDGLSVIIRNGDSFSYSEILQHNFYYAHGGSSEPLEDEFIISITNGLHETRNTVFFTILKVDKSAPVMLPSSSCQVNVTEGEAAIVTKDHLTFSDGDDTADEIIITLATEPSHGYFLINDVKLSKGSNFTQNDINQKRLKYQAEGEIGSESINDLIYLNVSDSSGNVLPKQILAVLITPVNNLAPSVFVKSGVIVNEGGEMPLNAAEMEIVDIDSPLSRLKVIIDTGPAFGHIENRALGKHSQKNTRKPVMSFHVSDYLNGQIVYKQTDYKDKEPAWDAFLFHVTDGINKSPLQRFNISIKLLNDEVPYIVTEQIFVKEGAALTLTNASMYVIDYDSLPSELIFTVETPPENGVLLKKEFRMDDIKDSVPLRGKSTFTYEDILNERIIYRHNDGETAQDNIYLSVSDGDFSDSKIIKIIVGLVGDETPRVIVNRGLRVKAGSVTKIKSSDLTATDLDSENSDITFTITKDPTAGKLQFDNDVVSYILNSTSLAKVFKQKDIDAGHISYIHTKEDLTGNIVFKFKLTDPEGNELIDQQFFITVFEDRFLPIKVKNEKFPVTEGKTAKLTTNHLSFTDADSEPGSLTYIILDGPQLGHLELTGKAGTPIVTFTQSDLAANSVIYVHTSSQELYQDRFTFAVSDGTNEVIQTFFIKIKPVDDSIPSLANKGLRVQEGVRKLITEFDLKAVDQDTNENHILFTIMEFPVHGSLDLLKNGNYEKAFNFTMEDIYENHLSYQHDGSETTQDSFEFVISDGTNKVFEVQQDEPDILPISSAQKFDIKVLPLDDGMPVLKVNIGLQYLQSSFLGNGNFLTSKELLSKDEDTPAEDIVYRLTEFPTQGRLLHTGHPENLLESFTQDDIDKEHIYYKLYEENTAFQDNFTFSIMDSKPNTVPNNQFHIQWSEISFSAHSINVSETQGVVRVPILRKGNLKQYSIVKCNVLPGSATSQIGSKKPYAKDFKELSGQVQFEEWEETKTCNIIINDDTKFEGPEIFYVEISSPSFAILGPIQRAAVIIHDEEDEPLLQFASEVIAVNETDKFVEATILRSGDLSGTISVVCSTKSLTATGSSLDSLESGSDFVSRGRTNGYRVVFPPRKTEKKCLVKLVDDSVYESVEQFEIGLSEPSIPASIGPLSTVLVIIEGPNDESFIYLAKDTFSFAEDSGTIEIPVLREGADLSHSSTVWCATRLSEKPSAIPGVDYQSSSKQIAFGPDETMQVCTLTLLDDEYEPEIEGNETFQVFLNTAIGSNLQKPAIATVIIFDDPLDVPTMNFAKSTYTVAETNKTLNVTLEREGDLRHTSSVICFTRQKTAEVMVDFKERPKTDESKITFQSGEKKKPCIVQIEDDDTFEADEVFELRLSFLDESGYNEGQIGSINIATITITNYEDEPRLEFENAAYSIHEPGVIDQVTNVVVKVIRTGDLEMTASVRCSTRDGSANSGVDYNPKSEILTFFPGIKMMEFPVDVLYNSAIEWHESFSVQLGPENPTGSQFGENTVATITILDNQVSGSLVLPSLPVVVSLLHYDEAEKGIKLNPSPGYPVICISPCEENHPLYTSTLELCEDSSVNQSALIYHWEVAMPPSDEDPSTVFVQVTDETLFTSSDKKVLDSIYFRPFFRVRCVAQLVNKNGNPGIPLKSKPVTIGHHNPICKSPSFTSSIPYTYQAQSFLASLKYVPPDAMEHPNTIHISVQIPHQDGMLPLISTQPLHNLRLLLAEPVYRQQHICSNIITAQERAPLLDMSFLGDSLQDSDIDGYLKEREMSYKPGFKFPHQFDRRLRESKSLLLYKNLNMKTCIWQFDAWYHMTELIDMCGGSIVSDFQVKDNSDAHLTVRVPLYVSYVFVQAPRGWGSLEHHTEMEVSFYYSTVLWKSGLETDERQGGRLQVVRILIGPDGKLMMEFKTQANFRGLFVMSHHTLPDQSSMILAPESQTISFDLELVWTQGTFDSPHQMWRAKSKYNLKDYTGVYKVDLIPCVVSATQPYIKAEPIPCVAKRPERFEIPVSFQQTNRPVPVIYSLDTNFQLSNSKKMFLLDPLTEGIGDEDWEFLGTFSKGQKLYGRVQWNPEQDLRTGYELILEKVYICTGRNGYVPSYDPDGSLYEEGPQFGCIQPSKNLLHRFLVLDRENTDVQDIDFQQVPFMAKFAYQDEEYSAIQGMSGVDGFVMDVDPLYKVDSGHQWYLQVLYTIRSSSIKKSISRRSISTKLYRKMPAGTHSLLPADSKGGKMHYDELHRNQRDLNIKEDNYESNTDLYKDSRNGTNIIQLHLVYENFAQNDSKINSIPWSAIIIPLIVVILLIAVIFMIFIRRRKRRKQEIAKLLPNNSFQFIHNPQNKARSLKRKEHNMPKRNIVIAKNSIKPPSNKCNIIHAKEMNASACNQEEFESKGGTEV